MQNEKCFSSLEASYESAGPPASAGDKCGGMREEQLYGSVVEASRPRDKRYTTKSDWQQKPAACLHLACFSNGAELIFFPHFHTPQCE